MYNVSEITPEEEKELIELVYKIAISCFKNGIDKYRLKGIIHTIVDAGIYNAVVDHFLS